VHDFAHAVVEHLYRQFLLAAFEVRPRFHVHVREIDYHTVCLFSFISFEPAKILLFFDMCKSMSKKKYFLLSKVKSQRSKVKKIFEQRSGCPIITDREVNQRRCPAAL
jgi:hypothetical protein